MKVIQTRRGTTTDRMNE